MIQAQVLPVFFTYLCIPIQLQIESRDTNPINKHKSICLHNHTFMS